MPSAAAKFAAGGFGGFAEQRLAWGDHCVDLERWWRGGQEGQRTEGTVLVHYTARGGRIAVVRFTR